MLAYMGKKGPQRGTDKILDKLDNWYYDICFSWSRLLCCSNFISLFGKPSSFSYLTHSLLLRLTFRPFLFRDTLNQGFACWYLRRFSSSSQLTHAYWLSTLTAEHLWFFPTFYLYPAHLLPSFLELLDTVSSKSFEKLHYGVLLTAMSVHQVRSLITLEDGFLEGSNRVGRGLQATQDLPNGEGPQKRDSRTVDVSVLQPQIRLCSGRRDVEASQEKDFECSVRRISAVTFSAPSRMGGYQETGCVLLHSLLKARWKHGVIPICWVRLGSRRWPQDS